MVRDGRLGLMVWCALLLARPALGVSCSDLAACDPTDDPCVIDSPCTVIPVNGVVDFDLGNRDLVVQQGKLFEMLGEGTLYITARNVTLEPGSRLQAIGTAGSGATIIVTAAGDIAVHTVGNDRGRLDVSAGDAAGTVILDAAGGIGLNGQVLANASNTFGVGGTVDLTAGTGSIVLGGSSDAQIDARGGGDGDGGFVSLLAGQDVVVNAPIKASRGSGGDVILETFDGDVTTSAVLDVGGGGNYGADGGAVDVYAGGRVTIGAMIDAHANGGPDEDSGYGGEVSIEAFGGDVTLGATILAPGASSGDGGVLDVTASGSIVQTGSVVIEGLGAYSFGGDIALVAEGGVASVGSVNATGGSSGGSMYVEGGTGHLVSLAGGLNMTGTTGLASPGTVEIFGCAVTVSGAISNNGPFVFPADAFTTYVSARTFTMSGSMVGAGSTLIRLGEGATFGSSATLTSSGAGVVNRIEWLNGPPTFLVGASIAPAPEVLQVPTLDAVLPCCGACVVPTTTTSTSSTTSTTAPPATTTTSTSVTSTTVGEATTTTTAPPASTTSTTVAATTTTTTATTPPAPTTSTTATTPPAPTTTTTQPPASCLEMPFVGYDAIECRVGLLGETVAAEPVEAFGGAKRARRLGVRVRSIAAAIAKARVGKREARNLKRGAKKLDALARYVTKAKDRGVLEERLAERLRGLASDASSRMRAFALEL